MSVHLPLPTGPGWDLFVAYHQCGSTVRGESVSVDAIAAEWRALPSKMRETWELLATTRPKALETGRGSCSP